MNSGHNDYPCLRGHWPRPLNMAHGAGVGSRNRRPSTDELCVSCVLCAADFRAAADRVGADQCGRSRGALEEEKSPSQHFDTVARFTHRAQPLNGSLVIQVQQVLLGSLDRHPVLYGFSFFQFILDSCRVFTGLCRFSCVSLVFGLINIFMENFTGFYLSKKVHWTWIHLPTHWPHLFGFGFWVLALINCIILPDSSIFSTHLGPHFKKWEAFLFVVLDYTRPWDFSCFRRALHGFP